MAVPPPVPLRTRHTLFSVAVGTSRGLQLQRAPFAAHSAALLDRRYYGATQALGWPCAMQASQPSNTARRVIRGRG